MNATNSSSLSNGTKDGFFFIYPYQEAQLSTAPILIVSTAAMFWCYSLYHLVDFNVAESISRHLFIMTHYMMALGSVLELTFYNSMMIYPFLGRSVWSVSFMILNCILAIVGLHLIYPYRLLLRKSKLRLPRKLTPGFPIQIIIFGIALAIGYLFHEAFELRLTPSLNAKFVCFVFIVWYWYLTLDSLNLLGIAVKATELEITEKGKKIGEYELKGEEWRGMLYYVSVEDIILAGRRNYY